MTSFTISFDLASFLSQGITELKIKAVSQSETAEGSASYANPTTYTNETPTFAQGSIKEGRFCSGLDQDPNVESEEEADKPKRRGRRTKAEIELAAARQQEIEDGANQIIAYVEAKLVQAPAEPEQIDIEEAPPPAVESDIIVEAPQRVMDITKADLQKKMMSALARKIYKVNDFTDFLSAQGHREFSKMPEDVVPAVAAAFFEQFPDAR